MGNSSRLGALALLGLLALPSAARADDGALVFKKGTTLYATVNGDNKVLAYGVDRFFMNGAAIAYLKGSTLFLVADVKTGTSRRVALGVTEVEWRDSRLYHRLATGEWSPAD